MTSPDYRAGYLQGQKDLWRAIYDKMAALYPDAVNPEIGCSCDTCRALRLTER